MKALLDKLTQPLPETLPPYITGPLHLCSRDQALRWIHYPHNTDEMQRARTRLKFEELFYVQLNILRYASDHRRKFGGMCLHASANTSTTSITTTCPSRSPEHRKG